MLCGNDKESNCQSNLWKVMNYWLIWIKNMENCCSIYKILKTTLKIPSCKLVDNAMFAYKNN
jgi:hypothetical protein